MHELHLLNVNNLVTQYNSSVFQAILPGMIEVLEHTEIAVVNS